MKTCEKCERLVCGRCEKLHASGTSCGLVACSACMIFNYVRNPRMKVEVISMRAASERDLLFHLFDSPEFEEMGDHSILQDWIEEREPADPIVMAWAAKGEIWDWSNLDLKDLLYSALENDEIDPDMVDDVPYGEIKKVERDLRDWAEQQNLKIYRADLVVAVVIDPEDPRVQWALNGREVDAG